MTRNLLFVTSLFAIMSNVAERDWLVRDLQGLNFCLGDYCSTFLELSQSSCTIVAAFTVKYILTPRKKAKVLKVPLLYRVRYIMR